MKANEMMRLAEKKNRRRVSWIKENKNAEREAAQHNVLPGVCHSFPMSMSAAVRILDTATSARGETIKKVQWIGKYEPTWIPAADCTDGLLATEAFPAHVKCPKPTNEDVQCFLAGKPMPSLGTKRRRCRAPSPARRPQSHLILEGHPSRYPTSAIVPATESRNSRRATVSQAKQRTASQLPNRHRAKRTARRSSSDRPGEIAEAQYQKIASCYPRHPDMQPGPAPVLPLKQ
ncbi:hypothetical protein PAPYR_12108 [Paratrimastix pyriformis]|uniref:Chromo domain-containing protein n=1 Tax=Paratrimastix pyriformis TaxID=342808 RepID=A0ABQ8U4T3_9EUKA|nr:hypothetical protein PAPYR_12108 [Paratrimastix pyriformis]